jgi:hypothetical protein
MPIRENNFLGGVILGENRRRTTYFFLFWIFGKKCRRAAKMYHNLANCYPLLSFLKHKNISITHKKNLLGRSSKKAT